MFREHGYEGTSTRMLLKSMGIGRQSFYDTFGDKLSLYHSALKRYADDETRRHLAALRIGDRGLEAIRSMLLRVIADAREPCLGIGSICEFGCRDAEVNQINAMADKVLQRAIIERLEEARTDGALASGITPQEAMHFVMANVASIRISARAGASRSALDTIERLVMRALAQG